MDSIQIIVISIIVLLGFIVLAIILAFSRPKRNENIDLKTKLLENGDLDWKDLNERELIIVNHIDKKNVKENIYGNLL